MESQINYQISSLLLLSVWGALLRPVSSCLWQNASSLSAFSVEPLIGLDKKKVWTQQVAQDREI